jgi:ATP-binding cassette subfamily F protein 3
MAYGDNRLFTDLSVQIAGGDRLGITGPNGTGKTTLLKILLGEVTASRGPFELLPRLRVGYYSQDHAGLDPKRSIVDEIRAVRPEFSEQNARSFSGGSCSPAMMF